MRRLFKRSTNPLMKALGMERSENERLKAQVEMLQAEAQFWSAQAISLQNHLQTVMRGQGNMLQQMARSGMCSDDVKACVDEVREQLSKPLTSVPALQAVISMNKPGTQGSYTALEQAMKEIE